MAVSVGSSFFDDRLQGLLRRAEERLEEGSEKTESPPSSFGPNQVHEYRSETAVVTHPYVVVESGVARKQATQTAPTRSAQKSSNDVIRCVDDPIEVKERAKKKQTASAGSDWYNLPRTNLTPALKRDFQMLQMRNVLDSHRHYRRSDNEGKIPEYSQVGTIVEGPTEFYSGRIQKRDRKQTLAEEILATEDTNRKFKAKYAEIQAKKSSGKKAHYKAKKARRIHGQSR